MNKILKIGAYVRVSTDEQRKFGYSVAAQIERINKWIDNEKHTLIDMFVDEGFTAANMKRPALQEMLSRLTELDAIVFTKLDRFSRNVLEANKMLETLQKYNVAIIAIDEDIETKTADGLFQFQLKVSLAELELKKTSERIRAVFEYKIKAGQAITGCLPLGYKVVNRDGNKYIGIDEKTEHIVNEIFAHFGAYHSARATMQHINDKYGLNRCYNTFHNMLKNPFFTGAYKGNENYCPAYITPKQFVRNQEILKNNIRVRKTKHVHLFSSLIKCPVCGCSFTAQSTTKKGKVYYSYRCNGAYMNTKIKCSLRKTISELTVENFLLANVEKLAAEHVARITNVKPVKRNSPEKRIKEIREEIENLNYMFKKRRIKPAEYDRDFEELEKELKKLSAQIDVNADITAVNAFLNSEWDKVYNNLERANKRALWRNLIRNINIDTDFNISVDFL